MRTRHLTVFLLVIAVTWSGLTGCGGADGPVNPTAPLQETVIPSTVELAPFATQAFQAPSASSAARAVVWSVVEVGGGTIDVAGLYTAPGTAGVYHVVATSATDPTRSGSATVVVASPAGTGAPGRMPVISRGVPAYTSGGYTPDSAANDGNYAADWLSRGLPAWIALDLSGVPASQRGAVVAVWYNARTWGFDAAVLNNATYSLVGAYTIDGHPAPGGGAPPPADDPGWVTLASVTGNQLSSRQHLVDLGGRNWIRMHMTAPCPRNANANQAEVGLNLDIHDASVGAEDDWLFVGDSITAAAWRTPGAFAQGVNAARPTHFPAAQNAGIGYQTAASTAARLPGWLADFPGRYVAISLGTNDANTAPLSAASLDAFYAAYESMVRNVIAAGKVPVVPTIVCSSSATIQANLPALNARLASLRQAYPQILPGPDLYAAFQGRPELFADTIHPNDAGYALLRTRWIEAMLGTVYTAP